MASVFYARILAPQAFRRRRFDAMARLQKAVCRFETSQSMETDKETI